MSADSSTRRWLIPAFIVGLSCFLLVLYAVGCRIIDPGYGNGYVPEGPTITLFQSTIQSNQEYRIQGEGFELLIPTGAMPRAMQLSVFRTLRETNIFPVPASWTVLSNVYTISHMGGIGSYNLGQLYRPAALRIPFATDLVPTGADQSDIFIACYDAAQGLILRTPSIDMTNGMAMIETYHFSMWAVVARPVDLRPKAFPNAPLVETDPTIMAATTATRYAKDLAFTINFELPSGAATTGNLSGWYLQFFPAPATGLVLGHPTINGSTRPLTAGFPFLEPIDLLKDPLVTRTYDGSRGTFAFRLIFTDKTPADAPATLIWRLGARDPLGILYEREGHVTFTVENRQIVLTAPFGSIAPATSIPFTWNLLPGVGAYESVLLQIADHPEGFLLPRFETLLKPATTTYTLDADATLLLPSDKQLY